MKKNEMRHLIRRIVNCIAATIAGEKPATLVNLTINSGDLDLWNQLSHKFNRGHISSYELKREERRRLVLFYNRCKLENILNNEQVRRFLSPFGYRVEWPLERVLAFTKERFDSCRFPHEIGVFLGIPLKDVMGFMGLIPLPYTQSNMWKIYGDTKESLEVVEKYQRAEDEIRKKILLGEDPLRILNGKE